METERKNNYFFKSWPKCKGRKICFTIFIYDCRQVLHTRLQHILILFHFWKSRIIDVNCSIDITIVNWGPAELLHRHYECELRSFRIAAKTFDMWTKVLQNCKIIMLTEVLQNCSIQASLDWVNPLENKPEKACHDVFDLLTQQFRQE